MTEQTMGLIFFLKRSRNKQSKLALIYARVTVKGIAKEWSIQRKWYADRWNQKIGRATDKKENAKSINQTLDSLTAKFIRIKNELIDTDVPITAEVIKNKMTGAEVEKMLLVEFQNFNDQIFSLIGKEYAKGTHDRFVTARLHTESFILYKYQKKDLPIKSLNYEFISDFAHWLKTVRNCGHNVYFADSRHLISFQTVHPNFCL